MSNNNPAQASKKRDLADLATAPIGRWFCFTAHSKSAKGAKFESLGHRPRRPAG